ncbi:MAG: hypothetical protein ACRCVV_14050, partial [Shewanella sp.]
MDVNWEPHAHFLVFEAWFTNVQSRLLGATNVYQMRLYLTHSQSVQLYQMTNVERHQFKRKQLVMGEIKLFEASNQLNQLLRKLIQFFEAVRNTTHAGDPCWSKECKSRYV